MSHLVRLVAAGWTLEQVQSATCRPSTKRSRLVPWWQ
ncbi:MAG: hypothetical protein ACRDRF_15515 [Pseudonocardiaceae bacterium]